MPFLCKKIICFYVWKYICLWEFFLIRWIYIFRISIKCRIFWCQKWPISKHIFSHFGRCFLIYYELKFRKNGLKYKKTFKVNKSEKFYMQLHKKYITSSSGSASMFHVPLCSKTNTLTWHSFVYIRLP